MKVFILTEGGKDIGFGHITRCISLYQAFEEKDITPEFIVNEDKSILDLLRGKNYQIFDWYIEKNRLFEIVSNASIVIIDSYLADKSLYEGISEIGEARLVIIDDYNRLEYPKGILVSPSIYGDRLNYPQKDGSLYLLGKNYIILRKEFWDIPEKKIDRKIKDVLITFGGIGHYDLAHNIIDYLKDRFDFNFFIVNPKKNKIVAKEMLSLMLKVDVCISAGGQTTYELARVGVPTAGICFAENQRLNLEEWQKRQFIEYVGWHNDEHLLEKIRACFDKFISYEERARRSKIGRNYVDGQGGVRIVNTILKKNESSPKRNLVTKSQ